MAWKSIFEEYIKSGKDKEYLLIKLDLLLRLGRIEQEEYNEILQMLNEVI